MEAIFLIPIAGLLLFFVARGRWLKLFGVIVFSLPLGTFVAVLHGMSAAWGGPQPDLSKTFLLFAGIPFLVLAPIAWAWGSRSTKTNQTDNLSEGSHRSRYLRSFYTQKNDKDLS